MQKLISYLLACASAAAFVPSVSHAAMPYVQLSQTVLVHIPTRDIPSFKTFIANTLNDGVADKPVTWTSSTRRQQVPVNVQLTPGPQVSTRSAGQCRLLSALVSQRSTSETWNVLFCQQADNEWKISGLQ
jgi:hypothetical protein